MFNELTGNIKSINVSTPLQTTYNNKPVSTAIHKKPVVHNSLFLSTLNLEGDAQADLVNHGGLDKAVCVYAFEHYAYWEEHLKTKLSYGAFGENLTVEALNESNVFIGDLFQLGEAVVQASQPRQPCYKLSLKYGVREMPALVEQTGFTGYYFRVLKEGNVSPSDKLCLLQRAEHSMTIMEANRLKYHDKNDLNGMKRLVSIAELSDGWRQSFLKRIHRLSEAKG